MKKSFLLINVILDIVIISLILTTSLNIVNITNKVNVLTNSSQLQDSLQGKIVAILDKVHTYSDYIDMLDFKYIDKLLSKDLTQKTTITPMVYEFENNGSFYTFKKLNTTKSNNFDFYQIEVKIYKKDQNATLLSLKKIIQMRI